MTKAPLNVALAGSGAIAHDHLESYLALPHLGRVTAILTEDPRRTALLAARAGNPLVTTSLDEIIAGSHIDAVDVCGHTLNHAPVAIAALRSGKHVLIEKPPALTLDAFDSIVDAANASGTCAMIGQTVRYQPAITELIDRVDAGTIGEPMLLHVSWYAGHVWPRAWRGWQLDPGRSGGHLIHNGMHSLDLALRCLRQPAERVFTRGWKTYSPGLPTPDSFHMTLRFTNGALATLETTYGLRPPADPVRRIMVAGTHGTLLHDTTDDIELHNPSVAGPPPSVVNAMTHEIAAWLNAIHTGAPSPIPLPESRAALACAIAAQQSLESGLPVTIHQATGPQ